MYQKLAFQMCVVLVLVFVGTVHADLVGHWKLDEGSGRTVADSSGNGNDGVFESEPSWIEGVDGAALEFHGLGAANGLGDRVNCGNGPSLNITGPITLALWIKPEADDPEGAGMETAPLAKADAGLSPSWSWQVRYGWGSPQPWMAFTFNTSPRAWAYVGQNLTRDEWVHIAGSSDGAMLTCYLNGEETESTPMGAITSSPTPFLIGSDGWGSDWIGGIDDVRVYNHGLSPEEVVETMMIRPPELSFDPIPEHEDGDVSIDALLSWSSGEFAQTHDVYLGQVLEDVNNATAAVPLGVVTSLGQADNSFDPGRLSYDATYHWRVDEVNGAPDSTVFKGETWSFVTEPFSIPITNITAAGGSFGASTPEKSIDGSGLVDDLHGVDAPDMWISAGIPATIEYAFDRAYKLDQLWVWNSNQLIEAFVGFGAKDIVIEHSSDGENWTILEGVAPLAQAPGAEGYAHNNTIDFGGVTARHVRITINSVHGIAPQASLSEVRFFTIPTSARKPDPGSGAAGVAPDVTLSWGRDGREADHHEIYLGTDPDNLPSVGNVADSSFDTLALDLQLGETYSWRVDEVNEAMDPSTWEGTVWNFTTVDTISIDDMESYKDEEFLEIWATWVDGFDDPANGSLVGNGAAGTPEKGIVHGGKQSLPLSYGNSAAVSEATRTFDAPMDWTQHGVQGLVLWFQGSPANTGGALYVKINDTRVAYDGDASDLMSSQWTQWYIPLANMAGNLSGVNSLTIGIDGGGIGVVYVDDIFLAASAPAAP